MSAARRRKRAKHAEDESKRGLAHGPSSVSFLSPALRSPLPTARAAFSGPALWVSLALITVTVVVYAPVRHHDFVNYDDAEYVSENPQVSGGLTWHGVAWAFTTGYEANWFPLTRLSHMLDVQLYGMNPGGHHLTNVLLHIVNTLLLFGLLHRMTGALGRSAFVAALFAVHPLHVESVAWVAERKDVLSTLFWMLTLWAYVRYVGQPQRGRYVVVLVLFALGLMAKPMLVTLPLVLLLLDVWPLQRVSLGVAPDPGSVRRLVQEKLPLLALTVASSIITFVVQQRGGAVAGLEMIPLSSRVANALVSYVAYLGKMLWPTRLAPFYPYPHFLAEGWVVGSLLGLILVTVLVMRAARSHPYLPVGWLWYLGTLLPVIGLIQVGSQSMADRYTYVPLIGLFITVAWGVPDLLSHWPHRSIALPTLAGLVTLACAITAGHQVRYWKSGVELWTHELEVTTASDVAHNNLGFALASQGKFDEAMAHYVEALRIKPNYAEAHNNLGIALANQGKFDEAMAHSAEALRIKPNYAEAHSNLGAALAYQGKVDEAMAHYAQALRIKPSFVEAHNNLGLALASQGKFDEAMAHYAEALRIKPSFAEAHNSLGAALANQGKGDEAIVHYSEALRIKPGFAEAHNNLGLVLASQGKADEAMAHYAQALHIKADFAEAHNNLGRALADQGRGDEAIVHYAEALRINSHFALAHNNLGLVLASQGKVNEAILEFSEAVRIKPDYTQAHYNLGLMFDKTGNAAEALPHWETALKLNPNYHEARQSLDSLRSRGTTPTAAIP